MIGANQRLTIAAFIYGVDFTNSTDQLYPLTTGVYTRRLKNAITASSLFLGADLRIFDISADRIFFAQVTTKQYEITITFLFVAPTVTFFM